MMEEKDLIQKLTLLKEIKPRENWVLFAKSRILEKAPQQQEVRQLGLFGQVGHLLSYLRYAERPAFVLAALALVVLGGAGYQLSQNSVPGDALYPVKHVLERASLASQNNSLASLEVAQRRLEDLKKVVETNKVKNLPVAREEFQKSVAEASRSFKELVENEPDKALQASRELVQLQKDQAHLEQVLGAEIGEKESVEIQNLTRVLVEAELNDLLERSLNEEQEEILDEAIVAWQAEDYETALERIWQITNQ